MIYFNDMIYFNSISFPDSPNEKLLTKALNSEIGNAVDLFKKKIGKHDFTEPNDYWQGFDDFVGYLSGCKLFLMDQHSKDKDCGGWADSDNMEIVLNFDCENKTSILCHEIGHILQAKAGIFIPNEGAALSEVLRFEQQCETIAAKLYSRLPFVKTDTRGFDTYFRLDDIEFLANWHGDYYQNDLILPNNCIFSKI